VFEFTYVRPRSVQEAGAFLAANPDAKLLAGGMTLIPTLKQRLAQPTHLVDIAGLAELRGVSTADGQIVIGAATRHGEIETSPLVKQALPALAYLASQVGDPQVRNLGTIGGAVANNDPAADYPAAVLALDGTITTTRRDIAASDYFQGLFATALEPGEIVTRISFPVPLRAEYARFAHPVSGYAMAGVFIAETREGIRVGVTGVGPGVFRWQEAEKVLEQERSVEAIEKLTLDCTSFSRDIHGTPEYRANLAKVMTKRAVEKLVSGERVSGK
jgi:aerobic carbon-monoxide dehydrogenase medium subunit